MKPQGSPIVGWVRVERDGESRVEAFFQYSKGNADQSVTALPPFYFEDGLEREARIISEPGDRWLSFPFSLYQGLQEINTAFALINLSGRPADVELTLRPDQTKVVRIPARGLYAGYVNEVWEMAVLPVYPLKVEGTVDVRSTAPLGVTVFRTLKGTPLSGVETTSVPGPTEILPVELDSEFQLSINQTAHVVMDGLQLTFRNLTEDSRCPVGAVCVWEGQATVALRLARQGQRLGDVTLTSRAGNEALATVEFEGLIIRLLKVEPYPDVAKPPIEIEDYVLTLEVTKKETE
jgi:hypothetical protein